ncbi:MAG: Hsp20/alpha crystallin family protein [Candidatus Hodarchaeales archaeon]|jgi:HSP20 family molecular chaperone IbpA
MSSDPKDFEDYLRYLYDYIRHLREEGMFIPTHPNNDGHSVDLNMIKKEVTGEMVNEPEYERIVDGDIIIMIFTLPGATKENIKFKRKAGYLIVEARTGDNRYYRKQVRLETYIDESSIKGRVKNGFLELRARKIYK